MPLRAFASNDRALRDALSIPRNAGTPLEPRVRKGKCGSQNSFTKAGPNGLAFSLPKFSGNTCVTAKGYVTKIGPKSSPARHASTTPFAYSHTIMRGAFVVQLGPETKPAKDHFEGSVQEVDSCTGLRFHSTEELLKFLGQRFKLAMASADEARERSRSEQVAGRTKSSGKERRSS